MPRTRPSRRNPYESKKRAWEQEKARRVKNKKAILARHRVALAAEEEEKEKQELARARAKLAIEDAAGLRQ